MKKLLISAGLIACVATHALAVTYINNQLGLESISSNPGGSYALTGNIDLNASWAPISTFSGTLDGNGYAIRGMISSNGLFAATSGATIYDLKVHNATVSNCSGSNVGILVGNAVNTAITDVEVNGSICGLSQVGGLVGNADGGSITNTSSYAQVNISGAGFNIGGLVGDANQTAITKSFVEADINATSGKLVGGIAGNVLDANVSGVYFKGDIVATGNAAGVVGYLKNGAVYDAYAIFDEVLAEGTGSGVVGRLEGTGTRVFNTYAVGSNVRGYSAGAIAGLIAGSVGTSSTTVYCNAALVDRITGIKDPAKPGNATIFRVFNNEGNETTPLHGHHNFSTESTLDQGGFVDTAFITDQYSNGLDATPNAYMTTLDYWSLFNDYLSECGFNSNSAWDTETEDDLPTLVDVGPSF